MKFWTVISLWVIAIALGITAYVVKFHDNNEHQIHTKLSPGDLLLTSLPIRDLTSVVLHQGNDTTTLVRGENNEWTVKERNHFPAKHELLRNLLGALAQLRITQGYPCSSEYYGRFGVADDRSSTPKNLTDLGLRVTMNASNSQVAEVFLGKYNGASKYAMGRFIRNAADSSGVYATGETFPGVYADPPIWLDPSFIKVTNIKSIELTAPNDPTFSSWKLVRASNRPKDQLILADLAENETMKLMSTGHLRHLFAVTSFQDVILPDKVNALSNPDKTLKRKVVITTFDGLIYTIYFWPQKAKKLPPPDPESPLPPVKPGFLFTVDLELEKTLSPIAPPNKTLSDYIALVQSFHNRIFLVGHTAIDPLLKSRHHFAVKTQQRTQALPKSSPINVNSPDSAQPQTTTP